MSINEKRQFTNDTQQLDNAQQRSDDTQQLLNNEQQRADDTQQLSISKRSLGKQLLIRNINVQREFIYGKLRSFLTKPLEAGDVHFEYKGHIHSMIKEELEKDGLSVIELRPATAISFFGCALVSMILISDDIKLSEEELEETLLYHMQAKRSDTSRHNGCKEHYSEAYDSDVDDGYFGKLVSELKAEKQSSSSTSGNTYASSELSDYDQENAGTSTPFDPSGLTDEKKNDTPISNNKMSASAQQKKIERIRNRQSRGIKGKRK